MEHLAGGQVLPVQGVVFFDVVWVHLEREREGISAWDLVRGETYVVNELHKGAARLVPLLLSSIGKFLAEDGQSLGVILFQSPEFAGVVEVGQDLRFPLCLQEVEQTGPVKALAGKVGPLAVRLCLQHPRNVPLDPALSFGGRRHHDLGGWGDLSVLRLPSQSLGLLQDEVHVVGEHWCGWV